MKSKEFRNDPLFLRNEFISDGIYGIPLIKKQSIDLNDVELIACSDISSKDTLNLNKGIHHFVDDFRFENLYNNAAKYALEGTRVYADVYSKDDNYVFTIKNVSAAKLNISPDELTERFVRGDTSRSTEGSGLGLSIAKSLTKLMGGELLIEIDGDLYKASVILPKHEEPVETKVTTGTLEIE